MCNEANECFLFDLLWGCCVRSCGIKHWLMLWVLLTLVACVSKEAALQSEIQSELKDATAKIGALKESLAGESQLANARILKDYARQLAQIKPSLQSAANLLAENADGNGPMVRALEARLSEVATTKLDKISDLQAQLQEVKAVAEAALPNVFNDALADSVNVLADLSGGQLPRIQAISQREQAKQYGAAYAAPGAQLIGNPQYGSWEPAPGGDYIWTWFAAYWFFDEVLDLDDAFEVKHYRYGHWSRHRPYSYYHDYGRYRYTSPKTLKKQNVQDRAFATTTQSKPSSQRHKSPYAKKAPGGGTVSLASRTGSNTGSARSARSSSPYAFTNTSSSRQGSARTSRGPRSGK